MMFVRGLPRKKNGVPFLVLSRFIFKFLAAKTDCIIEVDVIESLWSKKAAGELCVKKRQIEQGDINLIMKETKTRTKARLCMQTK